MVTQAKLEFASKCLLIALASALAFLTVSCTTTRTFDSNARAENEVLSLAVEKVFYKWTKSRVRMWVTIQNKSDEFLYLNYGGFSLRNNGKVHGGALRVPFARVIKDLELSPRVIKDIGQPLEFLGVERLKEGTLVLDGVRIGKDGRLAPPLSIRFSLD